jgi:RecA-family ATPase
MPLSSFLSDSFVQPLSSHFDHSVEWLWPGRLGLGKLAILDGDPGLGKSLLTLDWTARLSTGRPFPDGEPSPGPASVLILNGEDDIVDTVKPRLIGLGADLERVFVLSGNDPEERRANQLMLPVHLPLIESALTKTDARLLVIDPIMAFMEKGILTSVDQSVRQVMGPLAKLAQKHRCAVLMVRHLNKSPGLRASYRGGGSIGILGACRWAWLVAADPELPQRRVLAQVKNNLGADQPSLVYEIVQGENNGLTMAWQGTLKDSADDLLAGERKNLRTRRPRDRQMDLLIDFLKEKIRAYSEVQAFARTHAIAERTLHRIKKEAQIHSQRWAQDGMVRTYWLLPGQNPPQGVPMHNAPIEELADLLDDWKDE